MSSPLACISPPGVLVGSFAGAILLGAGLLWLPFMQGPKPVSFLDCLFTSTSAICVTGLTSVDTGLAWSPWGLGTIALLIQTGGLGIMTFSMAMIHLAGKKPSLRSHLALKGALGPVPGHEIGALARDVILYTLIIEALGILALFARFAVDQPLLQALGNAAFHGISAFCNAGFSIYSENLEGYIHDPAVNIVIMALIVLGGLGFLTLRELLHHLPRRQGGATPPPEPAHQDGGHHPPWPCCWSTPWGCICWRCALTAAWSGGAACGRCSSPPSPPAPPDSTPCPWPS